jgi:hypothetical protein
MVAKNTATTRQAPPDLFQTVSARASIFRRTSATWTSMRTVLKTKALSPSGIIVWSCRSIDRYCQRRPKLLIQLALLSTWPLECSGGAGHRGDDRASARRPTTWLRIARPQARLSYSKHPPSFLVSIIVAGATMPASVARFRVCLHGGPSIAAQATLATPLRLAPQARTDPKTIACQQPYRGPCPWEGLEDLDRNGNRRRDA